MKKIGHRGLKGVKLENTLESMEEAVRQSLDMIEIDIQMTKDEKIIVFHDYELKRIFNNKSMIKDISYTEILDITDKIPLLENVLILAKNSGIELNIEIKELYKIKEITEQLLNLIKKYDYSEKILISSFDHTILKEIKRLDNSLKTAVLTASKPVDPIMLIKAADADGYNSIYYFVDEDVINKCHAEGYFVNIWTVNSKKDIEKYRGMGVDGIISDYNLF